MVDTVLSLMAHPDDAEILCGGTLALLADRGWKVHVATLTPGDCGTATLPPEEIAAIRRGEARAAAELVGGVYHCLESRDLMVRYETSVLTDAIDLLREVRPRLIIAHSPADYMIDHEEASRIARGAAFAAPMPNAPSRAGRPPCEAVPHLYYADPIEGRDILGRDVKPALLVNIEDVLETKLAMLARHASQREWLRSHHGVDEYLDSARRWAAERGRLVGGGHAEGFRQHLGHGHPRDNLLAAALAGRATEL